MNKYDVKILGLVLAIYCFSSCIRGEEFKNTNKFEKHDVAVVDSLECIQGGVSWFKDSMLKSHGMREDISLPNSVLRR